MEGYFYFCGSELPVLNSCFYNNLLFLFAALVFSISGVPEKLII